MTKKNGLLCVLETGEPHSNSLLKKPIFLYSKYIVPRMGQVIANNKEAYGYLHQSSMEFPSATHFIKILKNTHKYTQFQFKSLCFGASFIYSARVL